MGNPLPSEEQLRMIISQICRVLLLSILISPVISCGKHFRIMMVVLYGLLMMLKLSPMKTNSTSLIQL